jgi:hypothetical protein
VLLPVEDTLKKKYFILDWTRAGPGQEARRKTPRTSTKKDCIRNIESLTRAIKFSSIMNSLGIDEDDGGAQ